MKQTEHEPTQRIVNYTTTLLNYSGEVIHSGTDKECNEIMSKQGGSFIVKKRISSIAIIFLN